MEGRKQEVNMENIKQEVELIELISTKSAEEKFMDIINRSGTAVTAWILNNQIKNWNTLKKLINEKDQERKSTDKIVMLGAKQRLRGTSVEKFIEETSKELSEIEVKEETICRVLAYNLWPGIQNIQMKLKNCNTLEELKYWAIEQEKHDKNRSKLLCESCNKKGHTSSNCRSK